jgi:hypothetical protein
MYYLYGQMDQISDFKMEKYVNLQGKTIFEM